MCESVLTIRVFAVVLREGQECILQPSTGYLETAKGGISRQQCAHNQLGLASMDFHRFAVLLGIGHTGNLQQITDAEPRDATDALAAGLCFDFGWRAFRDDRSLIDYGDAVS